MSPEPGSPARMPDRALLLYARLGGGREAMVEAAEAMGYVHRPRRRVTPVGAPDPLPRVLESQDPEELDMAPVRIATPAPVSTLELEPVRFWRPVAREVREDLEGVVLPSPEPSTTEAVQPEDLEPGDATVRRHEPLVSWPRLWRVLEDRLRTPRPRRSIDVEHLVRRWSRGEAVRVLPRHTGLAHASLTVVVDSSDRLMPFQRDQMVVLGRLARRLGRQSVRQVDAAALLEGPLPALDADERILALSDLGAYGSPETRAAWARLGTRLGRSSPALPVALVPCPASSWPGWVRRGWEAVDWERPSRRAAAGSTEPAARDQMVEEVLCRASVAQRLETGLTRELRRLVGADAGVEVALWQHPDVVERSPGGLVLEPSAVRRLREAFRSLPASEKAAVARLLERWHRALPEVLAFEVVDLVAGGVDEEVFDAEVLERSYELLARICRRVARGRDGGEALNLPADAFFHRSSRWSSLGLWRDSRLRADLERAGRALRERYPGIELPTGVTPETLAKERSEASEVRRQLVVQRNDGLALDGEDGVSSPVVELLSRETPVHLADGRGSASELRPGVGQAPPCTDQVVLATDIEAVSLEAWQPVLDDATSWASAAGRDEYGLWAAFEVGGVQQRLRWVPPGRFWMGSPESEVGRWRDEGPQHPVTLSEGFWLAETPCTQALWRAVMQKNPSRFKGDERPVEQVSWNDCQRFLDRLNQRFRHLDACLPTEAEWEYACRAGTDTATWRGDLEISEKGEARLLADIAWYEANSGGETHVVGTRKPNPWGLYDLLGTVEEWCWDWVADYRQKMEIDPEGPSEGSMRVLRGGSREVHARYLRAACRFACRPMVHLTGLGFRLSRGTRSGFRGQRKEPWNMGSEAVRRGTSRRARSQRSRAWIERLGWANDGGTDVYGRWASFEVDGVVTRLRWMCPGSFWMGSPETEEGRYFDEGQSHEVILNEGFWIAETPCTQDLWMAVMGSNPSEFRSPRRPVEIVSWGDVQGFLAALDERLPGLEPRLPTEAWWEYACRAGTSTATWLGNLKILGERNAPLLDDIAWYGGNSGVSFDLQGGWDTSDWTEKQYPHALAGTREVALKRPNPWGLYDMLGNVWEWCSDFWAETYPEGPRTDPAGPEQGSGRVIRGGSWDVRGCDVRAACRSWGGPDDSSSGLGFRLSRGPE